MKQTAKQKAKQNKTTAAPKNEKGNTSKKAKKVSLETLKKLSGGLKMRCCGIPESN